MQLAPASSTIGDEVVGTPSNFGPALLTMLLPSSNRIGLDNDNNAAIIIQSWLRGIIYLPTPSPIRGVSHITLLEPSDWTVPTEQTKSCRRRRHCRRQPPEVRGAYVGQQRRQQQATTSIIVVPTPVSSHACSLMAQ